MDNETGHNETGHNETGHNETGHNETGHNETDSSNNDVGIEAFYTSPLETTHTNTKKSISQRGVSTKSLDLSVVKEEPKSVSASASAFLKGVFASKKTALPEITYFDIEVALGESYIENRQQNKFSSNALDVLALYIKGQKLLYTEAKTYCEQQLNFLMLPAIFISCVGSIFSFLSDRYIDGALIIACLNGFNAFLLSLISYLKLDAKAQAHKTSAYKFDKLESMCEFNSGKFMFFANEAKEVMDVVEKIEAEVKEIKETNQFILPESIRYEFTFTYSTNIFLLVKKIQSLETAETHHLRNVVQQLNAWQDELSELEDDANTRMLNDKIRVAIGVRDGYVNSIMDYRRQYFELDKKFNDEIEMHIRRANTWFLFRLFCCDWLKS
jgi:hypothetical protein